MNAPLPTQYMPDKAIFVSRSESSVRMDAKSLRGLGVSNIIHMTNIDEAIGLLEKENDLDIIVCEEQLDATPASVFLYALARHPSLRGMPVLVLASNSKSARLLRMVGVTVLERPYTVDQLTEKLQKVMSPKRMPLQAKAFEKAAQHGLVLTPRQRTAPVAQVQRSVPLMNSDLYQKGVTHLKRQEYEPAKQAFNSVLERQEDHLEACLGLARAYQAEHNMVEVRKILVKAAAICLRKGDRIRAGHIATMLPQHMRSNIFASEALIRMQDGQFRAAALSFLEAANSQSETPLHRMVARACLLTSSPEDYMRKLCDSMERVGHGLTAKALRTRLLNYPEFKGSARAHSWLDRYPRLKEAVSVASYAAWAWKQA